MINLPGFSVGGKLNSLISSAFVSGAEIYFNRALDLHRKQIRATQIGNGTGASGNESTASASATGQVSSGASGGKVRGSTASSIRAINTRRGKFGDTKLKPGTARKLKNKGFAVGKSTEIPLRNGQNRPK